MKKRAKRKSIPLPAFLTTGDTRKNDAAAYLLDMTVLNALGSTDGGKQWDASMGLLRAREVATLAGIDGISLR